jgi:inosine-uridine nucleoside N-ribohydrolase
MQFGKGKPAPGVFIDSDFSTIDSVLAVALIYGMQDKNECRMITISMSRGSLPAAAYLDVVERFFHGPAGNFSQLPAIGMPDRGAPLATPAAYVTPLKRVKADGSPAYKVQVTRTVDTADPCTLFRNYLEAQWDGNASFVLAGPATNLVAALDFRGMKPLIQSKLKYLVFASGPGDANVRADVAAAKRLFAEWPTPIVVSGQEVGASLPFPGASVDKEFAATSPDHPVADAYRAYKPMPYDAPSWAMTAALYAGRPNAGYFKISDPGVFSLKADGTLGFTAAADGKHHSLIFDPAQKDRILADYVQLASAKPVPPRRFFKKLEAEDPKADPAKASDPDAKDAAKDAEKDAADAAAVKPN